MVDNSTFLIMDKVLKGFIFGDAYTSGEGLSEFSVTSIISSPSHHYSVPGGENTNSWLTVPCRAMLHLRWESHSLLMCSVRRTPQEYFLQAFLILGFSKQDPDPSIKGTPRSPPQNGGATLKGPKSDTTCLQPKNKLAYQSAYLPAPTTTTPLA